MTCTTSRNSLLLIKFIFHNMFSPYMYDFMNILVCKNVVLFIMCKILL